jgi:site-specific DNA recombinase
MKTLPIGVWQPASVHNILTYEPYCTGVLYFNRLKSTGKATRVLRATEEWIPLQVPILIERETFGAAQEQLARNKRYSPRNRKRTYLLAHLFRCGQCGRAMSGYYNARGQNPRYRCSSAYDINVPTCRDTTVAAAEIEGYVWETVENVLRNPALIAQEVQRQSTHVETERAQLAHELSLCEKALARCDREAQRWATAYAAEVISVEELRQYRGEIEARRQSITEQEAVLQGKLAALAEREAHTQMLTAYCKRVAAKLQRLSQDEKRLALDALGIQVTWKKGQLPRITSNISLDVIAPTSLGQYFLYWQAG